MFGGFDGSANNDVWTLDLSSYMWKLITTSGTKPNGRNQFLRCLRRKDVHVWRRPGSFRI